MKKEEWCTTNELVVQWANEAYTEAIAIAGNIGSFSGSRSNLKQEMLQ